MILLSVVFDLKLVPNYLRRKILFVIILEVPDERDTFFFAALRRFSYHVKLRLQIALEE